MFYHRIKPVQCGYLQMTALPFIVGPMRVLDDLGPLGQGASQARYVVAENGLEYIIKGAALTPDHPYVASNELVAAMLARTLGRSGLCGGAAWG